MFGLSIGYRPEGMMMLATGVCIGILVLIGIPAVMGLWRFIKELIQQTKDAQAYLYEIMDEKRAGFFANYLKEEIALQQEISTMGAEVYRKAQRAKQLKKYAPAGVLAVILFVLAVLLYPWTLQAWTKLMVQMGVIKNFSFACLASSIILFLYYMCCKKRERKKWKACFAVVCIGVLHFAGRMLGVPVPIPVEAVIPVFLALGAFHYNKWSKSLNEMTEILEYRLNEKRYAKDFLVKDYLELKELRKQSGYPAGMMKHDDEVDEMLIYLSWLEESRAGNMSSRLAEKVK